MNNEKTCNGCIWCDQCGCGRICEYYEPWNDDEENEEMVEKNRALFREEFYEYTEECC